MLPIQKLLEKVYISPGYALTLPDEQTRINDALELSQHGFHIIFGLVGPQRTLHEVFLSESRFVIGRLAGELMLGPYVTWPDGSTQEAFSPTSLAIWQRLEDNS